MNLIAIIPARAGSKGVPGKNMRMVGGKPLVQHAVEAARESGRFAEIYVSSDADNILSVAQALGVRAVRRPPELASDDAMMRDVVTDLHSSIRRDEGVTGDGFALLQPTSPLRTSRHVSECVDRFTAGDFMSAVAVCAVDGVPQKALAVRDGIVHPLFGWDALHANRQDLERAYRQNGAIWITRWDAFHQSGRFVVPPAMPYVMEQTVSIDIDSESDLVAAEAAFARQT